jgi:hypothetical protein
MEVGNMKICNCKDCPVVNETENSDKAINYGCLPDRWKAIKWFNETGKLWACHSIPTKACGGLLKILIDKGENIDFSKPLITEQTTLEEIYDGTIDSEEA